MLERRETTTTGDGPVTSYQPGLYLEQVQSGLPTAPSRKWQLPATFILAATCNFAPLQLPSLQIKSLFGRGSVGPVQAVNSPISTCLRHVVRLWRLKQIENSPNSSVTDGDILPI